MSAPADPTLNTGQPVSVAESSDAGERELADPAAASDDGSGRDRRGFVIAAAVVAACTGLVLYGILNTEDQPKPRAVPTAEVTYEVTGTGTAEISYLARSEAGDATVEKAVKLPWTKSVQVPLGKAPSVNITLDGKGGQALCSLAIRGKHIQSATASGTYGRATCTGELPTPAATEESTG
nr:MmpS family transport accessory protein [Streptomyces sp. NBC_00830]